MVHLAVLPTEQALKTRALEVAKQRMVFKKKIARP